MGKLAEFLKEHNKSILDLVEDDELSGRFITPGEGESVENIINEYIAGKPVTYLAEKYNMSSGQIRSHLDARSVPMKYKNRAVKKGVLHKLKHLTQDDIKEIIDLYQSGVKNQYIFDTYKIHKNGLYHILDTNGVTRKSKKRFEQKQEELEEKRKKRKREKG